MISEFQKAVSHVAGWLRNLSNFILVGYTQCIFNNCRSFPSSTENVSTLESSLFHYDTPSRHLYVGLISQRNIVQDHGVQNEPATKRGRDWFRACIIKPNLAISPLTKNRTPEIVSLAEFDWKITVWWLSKFAKVTDQYSLDGKQSTYHFEYVINPNKCLKSW